MNKQLVKGFVLIGIGTIIVWVDNYKNIRGLAIAAIPFAVWGGSVIGNGLKSENKANKDNK